MSRACVVLLFFVFPALVLPARPSPAADLPGIEAPLRSGRESPGDSAVVVGIEVYPFLKLDVPYAQRDAGAFESLALYTLGIPASRVQLLSGPTSAEMEKALKQAGDETGPDGTVYVYFAGHGASTSDGRHMILGADVPLDADLFDDRGLTLDRIQQLAGRGGAATVLLVDACYAGVSRAGDSLAAGSRRVIPNYHLQARARSTVWTAAGPDEVAGPLDAVQHGAFSYLAIGALRGWADGELDGRRDGEVTTQEADLFVRRALKEAGLRSQHPSLIGEGAVLTSGRNLEGAPDLTALREASPGSESSDLLAELEQLREEQQRQQEAERRVREERQRKLAAECTRVETEATRAWTLTEELARAGGLAGELALRKFVDEYGDGVTVTIDGEAERILVPEASQARQWLDGYGEEIRDDYLSGHDYGMVRIEPGEFLMGSPGNEADRDDDEDQHRVRITSPFLLGETEVTQALWKAVMGDSPAADREQFWDGETHSACSEYKGVSLVGSGLPVHCVDWFDVVKFCNRLSELEGLEPAYRISGETVTWAREADGYRLPTEAEWEYAARAGRRDLFAGSDSYENVCSVGNVSDLGAKQRFGWSEDGSKQCTDRHNGLAPVGSYRANGWGLYDMTGNVWEWVWDWYGEYPSGSVMDPVGPSTGSNRVYRGGSWNVNPRYARVANRSRDGPGYGNGYLGFRLARSIP